MSLKPDQHLEIPLETVRVARIAFPNGNAVMRAPAIC